MELFFEGAPFGVEAPKGRFCRIAPFLPIFCLRSSVLLFVDELLPEATVGGLASEELFCSDQLGQGLVQGGVGLSGRFFCLRGVGACFTRSPLSRLGLGTRLFGGVAGSRRTFSRLLGLIGGPRERPKLLGTRKGEAVFLGEKDRLFCRKERLFCLRNGVREPPLLRKQGDARL
jgi:hypothetical protein